MSKKKTEPKNVQWAVTGRVTYGGAICIVHAPDRAEAIRKANAGEFLGEIDVDGAEAVDWDFKNATADTSVCD